MRDLVPLSALVPGNKNPRTTVDQEAIEELAASIKRDGLLQNLIVKPLPSGRFRVAAGNRRLRALRLLRRRGEIEESHPVPVEMRKLSPRESFRLATVENVQREQLPPMDEAEAFAVLLQKGMSIDALAVQVGVGIATVKRRLALASLCPEAKALVRAGELALDLAEALTLGTIQTQREVLARIGSGYVLEADDIRYLLIEGKPTAAMALFPLAEYQGSVTTDLFGAPETTYLDDTEEFRRLQEAAVERLVVEHQAADKWVEVIRGYTAPWWQYRQAEEGEAAGTVIHLAPNGRVEIREDLARHEIEEKTSAVTRAPSGDAHKRSPYTAALVRYVACQKSLAVQAALLERPRRAKEVAALMLLSGFWGAARIHLRVHPCWTGIRAEQRSAAIVEEQLGSLVASLGETNDIVPDDAAEQTSAVNLLISPGWESDQILERLAAAPEEVLDRLLYTLPILCFGQADIQCLDDGKSTFNRVAQSLEINLRRYWKPDEAFLLEHRKDQLEQIALASGGSVGIARIHGMKKGELVQMLGAYFDRTASPEPHAHEPYERGRTWLPSIMAEPAEPATNAEAAE